MVNLVAMALFTVVTLLFSFSQRCFQKEVSSCDGGQARPTGNWYLRDRVRKLVLVIKSFCPTHVTGGCSSLEQILGLVGTDGVDYYPQADICKECEDIKKEGAYTTVARDRLRIKNPTRISMQVLNLFLVKWQRVFSKTFMKYYHTSLRDIISCNWFRKGTRLLPRFTVS